MEVVNYVQKVSNCLDFCSQITLWNKAFPKSATSEKCLGQTYWYVQHPMLQQRMQSEMYPAIRQSCVWKCDPGAGKSFGGQQPCPVGADGAKGLPDLLAFSIFAVSYLHLPIFTAF